MILSKEFLNKWSERRKKKPKRTFNDINKMHPSDWMRLQMSSHAISLPPEMTYDELYSGYSKYNVSPSKSKQMLEPYSDAFEIENEDINEFKVIGTSDNFIIVEHLNGKVFSVDIDIESLTWVASSSKEFQHLIDTKAITESALSEKVKYIEESNNYSTIKELKDRLSFIKTAFNEGKKWDHFKKSAKNVVGTVKKEISSIQAEKLAKQKELEKKAADYRTGSGPGGIAVMSELGKEKEKARLQEREKARLANAVKKVKYPESAITTGAQTGMINI